MEIQLIYRYETEGTLTEEDVWTHIVIVYNKDGTDATFYKNGVELSDNAATIYSSYAASTDDTRIGSYETPTSLNTLNGSIDDIQIFDVALNSSQVEDLYYGSDRILSVLISTMSLSSPSRYVPSGLRFTAETL